MNSITRNGLMTNSKCWTTLKPFLTNEGMITSNELALKQWEDIINDQVKVVEILNVHKYS